MARNTRCSPKLDQMLERYFDDPSIRSISDIRARGGTNPTSLRMVDMNTEIGKLMRNLGADEIKAVRSYYQWRALADEATRKATDARQEARKRGKRRKFRTGIAEIERCYSESKKKAPR